MFLVQGWADLVHWLGGEPAAQALAAFVTALVTVALAVITFVYAMAAKRQADASARMAEEMREQRLLTTRPILLLSLLAEETKPGSGDEGIPLALKGPVPDTTPVRIINIGAGVAVEVRVPYRLQGEDPGEWVIDYLRVGSEEMERNFLLAPKEGGGSERLLKITYRDVFGNLYESTREFHKDPDAQHYLLTPLVHRELPRTRSRWKRRGMQSRKGNGPKGRAGG